MNKKLVKLFVIIFINVIILCSLLFIFNFYVYYISSSTEEGNNFKEKFVSYINFLTRDISDKNSYNSLIKEGFRPVENAASLKKPILIFGCSYAHGTVLKDNQTFSYKLGEYTKRPIYNRAKCGWGVQHMYYQLNNEDFYKMIPKPEFIIYVYMDGHMSRINIPVSLAFNNCYDAFYKKNKDKYILKKRIFLSDKIIIQHFIKNYVVNNYLTRNGKYNLQKEKEVVDYVIASRAAAEKHWGKDIKFIIFSYYEFEDATIKYIKDNNILLFNVDEHNLNLNDKQYQISGNDDHPNERAWDEIVPILVKKYNMN
jgi:hypothetical protein